MPTIRELASDRRILYYPEFAYLNPEHWQPDASTPAAVTASVARHVRYLKRCLLIFDAIYIPVGHLLFQPTALRSATVHNLLLHAEFRQIVDHGLVITDLWDPALATDLVEYRLEYLASLQWPTRPTWAPAAVDIVERFTPAHRSVTIQSAQLASDFDHYLADRSRPAMRGPLDTLRALRRRSSYKTLVPFAHERFTLELQRLTKKQPELEVDWRALNDLYWSRAEEDYGTAVYTTVGDHNYCRLTRCAYAPDLLISSCLYHPRVVSWFLAPFFDNLVGYLDRLSVDDIVSLRTEAWFAFSSHYHAFLVAVTERFGFLEDPHLSGDRLSALMTEVLLHGRDTVVMQTLGFPISLMSVLINAVAAHGAGSVAKATADSLPLREWLRRAMLEARHPDMAPFVEECRALCRRHRKRARAETAALTSRRQP